MNYETLIGEIQDGVELIRFNRLSQFLSVVRHRGSDRGDTGFHEKART